MTTKVNIQNVRCFLALFGFPILVTLSGCAQQVKHADDYNAEIVTSWNLKIMTIAVAEDGLLTLKGVRTASMMHIAMHDALNAIAPKYSHYAYKSEESGANPIASVAQAAYEVAVNQYPDKQKELKEELHRWMNLLKDDESKRVGMALGKASATSIVEKRSEDRWNGEADYTWHPMAPGVYAEFNEHSGTPEGFVFGAGWAAAKPFMLKEPSQFRSPPPPDIGSKEYTRAFDEVKEVGRFQSDSRTPDQAHMAMWWKDFCENSHNRLARHLVATENLNLWDGARTFALLNMAIYDAYVSVFDNKFFYNHWRPYTAIRWAANDDNPDTEPEMDWNNLHKHSYAFPSYPSAHGCASAAAMTALANTLGVGNEYSFTMTTEEVDRAGPMSEKVNMVPPVRSFHSFSEAAIEAAASRVYLGIHFRYDSEEGYKLGTQVGEYAVLNFLYPLN